ncbi:MAG: ATP-binding protein [Desulfobulbus sp.]|jgi:C4-dicarboxylate-specific signal transduction histidine kinase
MQKQAIKILEKQRQNLVVRVLRKHEEMESYRFLAERILGGISELVLLFDDSFRLVQSNREFYQRTGLSEEQTHHLTLEDLVRPVSTVSAIRAAFARGEFTHFEAHLKTASGPPLPVKMRGSTHTNPKGLVLHMLICSDCSELYELLEQMREGQKQLIHSGRLASLGEMTAGIGHELTQPLNAILLFARNSLKMLDAPGDNEAMIRENLEIIVERANRASSIIATMRSFGRRIEEEQSPVDFNEVIHKILVFLEEQFRLNEIALDLQLAEESCLVLGVEVRLEQVMLNLIQNAVQAMGRIEDPRLTITSRLVTKLNLTTFSPEPYVEVRVIDNGEGIPEDRQKKIFDPFFTTREAGIGMGLGLSIVDRIVRGFSGYIEVESRPDKGTCFSVFIPQYQPKSGPNGIGGGPDDGAHP